MRLLWLSHFFPYPPKGGAFQRSYNLIRLAAASHEVDLISLYRSDAQSAGRFDVEAVAHLRTVVSSLAAFPISTDITRLRWCVLVAKTGFGPTPYDVNWLRSKPMAQRVRALKADRYDMVHLDTIGLWPYATLLSGVPVALHHHNVESQLMERRAQLEGRVLHRKYFRAEAQKLRRLEAAACPAAAVNLVVSDLDRIRLQQIAPAARVAVVENAVDVDYFRPSPVEPVPGSLVFAGGMNWYPNRTAVQYFLADIWPRLVEADPNRSATFVGQDPPLELVRHPDTRLRATGFVDDVRPHLAAGEIYVCPIRDGGGTRLKILDAMAMGKPIVATSMAVEGLSLTAGVHFLPADTPQQFVDQIDLLRANPDIRRRLGLAGRNLVQQRYAWPLVGVALNRAYESALAGRSKQSQSSLRGDETALHLQ